MNRYFEQLQAWYRALNARVRGLLLASAGAGILLVGGLTWWMNQVPYSPLITGRDYEELLEAAAALEEAEVPYRILGVDGIEVPSSDLGRARAAVAERNALPGLGDVGELKLGLTPQAQKWAFLRAREGDVARMINGIDGIAASQVNIVPREESLYFEDERPASASVFLKMRPGAEISQVQVRAIVNLVSSAVDGLSPDRITVADDRGTLLASGEEKEGIDGNTPSSLLEYRSELEKRTVRSVSQALLPVLGFADAFSVTAAVELDLTSRETISKQVDTQKQAVVSEQIEESSDSKKNPGGVPGVDANLPERTSTGSSSDQASERQASTMNYVYPTVDEIARRPAGGVQRLSVAVQVDERRLQELAAASPDGRDVDNLKQEITRAVEAAVGADESRKDLVSVSFLPFAEPVWTEGTIVPPVTPAETILPWAVAALAILMVFVYIVRPIMNIVAPAPLPKEKPKPEPLPQPIIQAVAGGPVEAEQQDEGGDQAQRGGRETDRDLATRLRLLVDNYERVEASDLNRLVEREASNAVEVIRKWNQRR